MEVAEPEEGTVIGGGSQGRQGQGQGRGRERERDIYSNGRGLKQKIKENHADQVRPNESTVEMSSDL